MRSASSAQILRSRIAFRGPVFHVTSDIVREPGGVKVRRDIIRHPGSVVILAVDDTARDPRILLERQYRYAANARLWELPAGRIDAGETSLAAAKRELIEETGYRARSWRRILKFFVSPGFLDETFSIWMARGLQRGIAEPEEDERIVLRWVRLSAAVRMALKGTIRDGKTIAALLWLDRSRR